MNKDVIYIDVEDDITAIIGKVKDSKEKIVALVPPKRIGVLQSAVNLRLLQRAATQADKRLVLISNNSALAALAAAAKVPVAKNLQSKPELAEVSALSIDNGDDIIDGAQLPVGELARTADKNALGAAALSSPLDEAISDNAAEIGPRATPPAAGQPLKKPKSKSGKVPNFNKFRKKLIFGIGGGVLLLIFLIWAIFFAPSATVIITARTTDSSANAKVTLGDSVSTSMSDSSIKTLTETVKKDASVNITPTGTKEVGEKAKGTMEITRTSVSNQTMTVPAGTSFSSSGRTFVSTESATLSGTTVGPNGIVQDSATVNVQATEIGDEYNLSSRSYNSNVSGIDAEGSDMSGGSSKKVKVVSEEDAQKAMDELEQQSSDDIKSDLKDKFNDTYIVLDTSFKTDKGNPEVKPGVGQEVTGTATLSASVTYSLSGVAKADVGKFLDDYFKDQIKGLDDRRIYDNGADKASFTDITPADKGFTANLVATAKIGPKIEDENVKEQAKGKRYGEIQSSIEAIQGVDNVDVKFWPFWVSTAPNDTKKIKVEFNLNES
ncbi:MAG TPA: hypothetical protein VFS14_03620 [Candidatus Saccharimonadales bacterium]|nr:hypothetical protein [Candidatus Saccharimonadales bacterium]